MPKLFEYTAVGRYYKVYLDGQYISQHNAEREAIERSNEIKCDNPDSDVRYVHEYEVDVALTDAGITVAKDYGAAVDQPPSITSTPSPYFVEGTPATYDMTQHVSDDGLSTVTYGLSNTLPNGLTISSSTGILSYDGIGIPTVSQHVLVVTDAVDTVVSGSFNIEIAAASSTYPTTHYVAPFASVAGASSDEDEQDASAFAAATSPSTPCTVACFALYATAGSYGQMAPGIILSGATAPAADRWIPRFQFTNNGTAENPIVLFAQYPAAYNTGSPELLTEFRQTYGADGLNQPPIFFGLQGEYQIIDGIHHKEEYSAPQNDTGFIGGGQNAVSCEIRRCWSDRSNAQWPANTGTGENKSPFWFSDSINGRVTDCLITGDGSVSGRNDGGIQAYRAENLIVENNTISGGPGIYIKAEVIAGTYQLENVHVRNNLVTDPYSYSFRTSSARSLFVYNNIFQANVNARGLQLHGAAADTYSIPVWAYNNTIVITGAGGTDYYLGIDIDSQREHNNQSEFYNNIVVDATISGARVVNTVEPIGAEHDDIDAMARFNNNVYYAVNIANPIFARDVDHSSNPIQTWTSLSLYQSWVDTNFGTSPVYTSETYEDSSVDSDPEFVDPDYADVAAGDWRLQNNAQDALTIGATSSLITDHDTTVVGAFVTGNEEIGIRANPTY